MCESPRGSVKENQDIEMRVFEGKQVNQNKQRPERDENEHGVDDQVVGAESA